MAVGLGQRFALETGFLVLLAVVVGIADLSATLIILVMGIGWLLVSLIEYLAWRQGPKVPPRRQYSAAAQPAAAVEEEEEEEVVPPPPPLPPPVPRSEEQTMVEPPSPKEEPPQPEREAEPASVLRPTGPQRAPHKLEPLAPRPRRRWIVFGPRERPKE